MALAVLTTKFFGPTLSAGSQPLPWPVHPYQVSLHQYGLYQAVPYGLGSHVVSPQAREGTTNDCGDIQTRGHRFLLQKAATTWLWQLGHMDWSSPELSDFSREMRTLDMHRKFANFGNVNKLQTCKSNKITHTHTNLYYIHSTRGLDKICLRLMISVSTDINKQKVPVGFTDGRFWHELGGSQKTARRAVSILLRFTKDMIPGPPAYPFFFFLPF